MVSIAAPTDPQAEAKAHFRPGMPGYVLRDWEVVDYQCHELAGTGLWFRGPPPARLDAGRYFTAIGAAQTFGCFCDEPYPALLERRLGLAALNLGYSGAGPRFFCNQLALIDQINAGMFCVVQVMSGRSSSNALLDNPDGLAFGRRRTDGAPATAEEIFDAAISDGMNRIPLLPRRAKAAVVKLSGHRFPAVRQLVEEARRDWIDSYAELLNAITVPKILFWFSVRPPAYRAFYHRRSALFREYPHLIDEATLARITGLADTYVECVSRRGNPQPLISRFTGAPVSVSLEADRKPVEGNLKGVPLYSGTWHENKYYPSPEMQQDAAAMLEAPCRAILERAGG